MKRFSRMLAVGVMACSSGYGAMAQEVCGPGDREMIVTLSQAVLDGRSELTGFAPSAYGSTSAYFLYHYGEMSDAAALALFTRLSQGGRREAVRLADDMAAALSVHMFGVEQGLRVLDDDPTRALFRAHWYTQQAVLRADDGVSFFALADAVENDPAYDDIKEEKNWLLQFIGLMLLNLPVEDRLTIAQNAETAGHIVLAGILFASLDDGFSEFEALLGRLPDATTRLNVVSSVNITVFSMPSEGRYIFEFRDDIPDDVIPRFVSFARTKTANNRSGPYGWLGIYINLSGQEEAAARAADIYLAAVDAGEVYPWQDMEGAWLVLYRALTAQTEAEGVMRALTRFDVPQRATRHFAARAGEMIERMMMLEALTGEAAPDPQIADHPLMARLAEAKVGLLINPATFVPADELEAQMALEVLWRSGQREDALRWADVWLEPKARLSFYQDLAARLDLRCDGILAYPGRGLYLSGQPLFSFPPVPRSAWDN